MAVTDQLGVPLETKIMEGRYTLHRVFVHGATVAAPVAPVNIEGVQGVTMNAPTPERSFDVFMQGGGDEKLSIRRGLAYEGTIQVLGAYVTTFLATVLGVTFSDAGYHAMPLHFTPYPVITIESVCRQADNLTHILSKVYQELIIQEFNFNSPSENELIDVPFKSFHDPFILLAGHQIVYDVFTGDGSSTDHTLSSTPIPLTNVTLDGNDDWVLDNLVFCKTKLTADKTGVRQKSGISIVTTTLSHTTAPAAASRIEVMYAKAT